MTVHRPMVAAVALFFACATVAAGCGTSGAAVTTEATIVTGTTSTAETARLYPVRVDGKWGFIDKAGTIKIEPRFDNVEVPWLYGPPDIFSGGLAAVAGGD